MKSHNELCETKTHIHAYDFAQQSNSVERSMKIDITGVC